MITEHILLKSTFYPRRRCSEAFEDWNGDEGRTACAVQGRDGKVRRTIYKKLVLQYQDRRIAMENTWYEWGGFQKLRDISKHWYTSISKELRLRQTSLQRERWKYSRFLYESYGSQSISKKTLYWRWRTIVGEKGKDLRYHPIFWTSHTVKKIWL